MFEASWPYLYHCKLQAAANRPARECEARECDPRTMTPFWDHCNNLFVYKMHWAAYDSRLRKPRKRMNDAKGDEDTKRGRQGHNDKVNREGKAKRHEKDKRDEDKHDDKDNHGQPTAPT